MFAITWEFQGGMSGTVTLSRDGDDTVLELVHEAPVDPVGSEEWPLFREGKAFVTEAAQGWAAGAVRSGDGPGDAHAAAQRTIEHDGEPPSWWNNRTRPWLCWQTSSMYPPRHPRL